MNIFANCHQSYHHRTMHFAYQKNFYMKRHGRLPNNKFHIFPHIKRHARKSPVLFGKKKQCSMKRRRIIIVSFELYFSCITSIMNLLQMSSNCIPSADDLIPVLIYVVIKVGHLSSIHINEYVYCVHKEHLLLFK